MPDEEVTQLGFSIRVMEMEVTETNFFHED
jgi:hypothetical protein